MSEDNSKYDTLEKTIESNAELKTALLELQREAVVGGWTQDEHAARAQELLLQSGVELTAEDLLSLIKDSGAELTKDEMDQVSGGKWGKSCNKWKECPGGTGRSCYPHC